MQVKGNLNVAGKVDVGTRVNNAMATKALTGAETLNALSAYWQTFTATGAQDVNLPDATTLNKGWTVVIYNADGTDTLTVKNNGGSSVQTITAGKAYQLTCTDVSTSNGLWYIQFMSSSELTPAAKYSATFNNTSDWTDGGSYYTRTILQSTHAKGTTPIYNIEELNGSDYDSIILDNASVNATGDVEIQVTKTPDARFAGRITIS